MSDFCPVPWPEEPTPEYLIDCKECGLFKHGTRMIWGEGNPNASLMIILDNPGAREDKEGREFVCGTRQSLQQAANEVGLSEHEIYVTYVLKRQPRKKYDKESTRKTCMKHLKKQLKEKQPSLIFCMGNVAVQSFFGDEKAEVKTLRGKIHQVNGYTTAIAYHPLAIRRRPNLRGCFLEDWHLVVEEMNKQNFF